MNASVTPKNFVVEKLGTVVADLWRDAVEVGETYAREAESQSAGNMIGNCVAAKIFSAWISHARTAIETVKALEAATDAAIAEWNAPRGADLNRDDEALLHSSIDLTAEDVEALIKKYDGNVTMLRALQGYVKHNENRPEALKLSYGAAEVLRRNDAVAVQQAYHTIFTRALQRIYGISEEHPERLAERARSSFRDVWDTAYSTFSDDAIVRDCLATVGDGSNIRRYFKG